MPWHLAENRVVDVDVVQGVGVGGHGGALGQDVEPSEQSEARIKSVVRDMGVALGAQEFESKEGHEVVEGGNGFALREAGGPDHRGQVELGKERRKEEGASSGALERLPFQAGQIDRLTPFWNLGSLDGTAHHDAGTARQLGEAFLGQDPCDRTDGDLGAVLAKQFGDFPHRKALLAPGANLGTGLGVDGAPLLGAFGDRFMEIEEAMAELVP